MRDGDGDGNGGCNEINLELSLALPGCSKFREHHHEDIPPPLDCDGDGDKNGDENGDGDGGCNEINLELSLALPGCLKFRKHHHEDTPPQQQESFSSSLQRNKSAVSSSRKRKRRCTARATAAALEPSCRPATSSSARPPLNINQPVLSPAPPSSALPAIHLERQRIRPRPIPPPAQPPIEVQVRPPFSWAREHPTGVRSYRWLIDNGITHIHGEVRCSNCGVRKVISYELESKLSDIEQLVCRVRRHYLDDRALLDWMKAVLAPCDSCGGSKCVGPVIPEETNDINWLFMLLGQTLGTLNTAQLKDFCRCNNKHSTGAKDRLFFIVYAQLCRQLFPEWRQLFPELS